MGWNYNDNNLESYRNAIEKTLECLDEIVKLMNQWPDTKDNVAELLDKNLTMPCDVIKLETRD